MKMTIPDSVRQFLSEIGRKGGCVSTDKKVEAARANGAKGGRPRKMEICAATQLDASMSLGFYPRQKTRKSAQLDSIGICGCQQN